MDLARGFGMNPLTKKKVIKPTLQEEEEGDETVSRIVASEKEAINIVYPIEMPRASLYGAYSQKVVISQFVQILASGALTTTGIGGSTLNIWSALATSAFFQYISPASGFPLWALMRIGSLTVRYVPLQMSFPSGSALIEFAVGFDPVNANPSAYPATSYLSIANYKDSMILSPCTGGQFDVSNYLMDVAQTALSTSVNGLISPAYVRTSASSIPGIVRLGPTSVPALTATAVYVGTLEFIFNIECYNPQY